MNEAADAIERLRQRSIEALQLDLVRELSDDLQQKNDELQRVLLELQQTQDQIMLRQKLVELGELTAGVAHEIRNPLNFMKNFSEASEELVAELREAIERHVEDLDDDERGLIVGITDELADNMLRMRTHGDRANRIVRDMVMIGRGGGKPQPVDINDLLNDRAMIAYRSALALYEDLEIDINSDCDASVGEMQAVPEDMGRVFFNPFYTTKPSGTGVGLGLSLSSDVVRQHGGSITAQSEPGEFTEMTVRIPATDRGASAN